MTESVSGIPAPQFGYGSSWCGRIRAGSRGSVGFFRAPPGVRVQQVEHYCSIQIELMCTPPV
jgi:hypothetical protein